MMTVTDVLMDEIGVDTYTVGTLAEYQEKVAEQNRNTIVRDLELMGVAVRPPTTVLASIRDLFPKASPVLEMRDLVTVFEAERLAA